jgi:putative hydrolase of the HAD superfamily
MERITGLDYQGVEDLYWVDRLNYDRGDLTGVQFWEKLARDGSLDLTPEQIEELSHWDAHLWTIPNPTMIEWTQTLKNRGLRLGILSNMGDNVHSLMQTKYDWLDRFDALVWSYQHRIVKPDPEIYHLLLSKLGTAPEETLFLDDRQENIEGARRVGIQAIQFTTADQLRQDLISAGLDSELPLP